MPKISCRRADLLWASWVLAGCALEAICLNGENGATLTSQVLRRTRIPRHQPLHKRIPQAMTIGFVVWVPIHWVTGGKV
jgi:hypothetical protein